PAGAAAGQETCLHQRVHEHLRELAEVPHDVEPSADGQHAPNDVPYLCGTARHRQAEDADLDDEQRVDEPAPEVVDAPLTRSEGLDEVVERIGKCREIHGDLTAACWGRAGVGRGTCSS